MRELYTKPNPAQGLELYKSRTRERHLQGDEFPRFFQAVALEQNPDIRDYVLLSLITGARRSNVLGMRWGDDSIDG